MFSERIERALTFAALRHRGQTRKGTGAPYLTHPVHVAWISSRYGYDEDTQIVALLHDVLEDTCQSPDEIVTVTAEVRDRFGAPVALAVESLTEPKRDPAGARIPWKLRKARYVQQLEDAEPIAVRVSAADKIHNLATLLQQLGHDGRATWARFRGGPEDTLWFYRAVADLVSGRLAAEAIAAELTTLVDDLAARVERAR